MPTKMASQLLKEEGQFQNHLAKIKPKFQSKVGDFKKLKTPWEKSSFLTANDMEFLVGKDFGLIEKDLKKAMEFKEQGNAMFKTGQLMEAKDMYTKSLQHCPFDESDATKNQEYSIILANRSAVTDKVYLYKSAVQDIDLALKYNYPKALQYKVGFQQDLREVFVNVSYV